MEKHIIESFNESFLIASSEKYGFDVKTAEKLDGFENLIYSYKKDSKKYILRISHYDHRTLNDIEAEMEFIQYLKEQNAQVVTPVLSLDGNLVEALTKDEMSFMASSFEFAEGRPPSGEDISEKFYVEYGKVIANMHVLSKEFIPKVKRMEWYEDELFGDVSKHLPKEKSIVVEVFHKLIKELSSLPTDKNSYGLIHTDMHMGNFFINESLEFEVFDFDDCSYKWFVSDIAIVLFYSTWFTPNDLDRVDYIMTNFMKGYNEVNDLDNKWLLEFDLFLRLRRIVLYMVIYRSFDINDLPEWCNKFFELHEDNIINDRPFFDVDFSKYSR